MIRSLTRGTMTKKLVLAFIMLTASAVTFASSAPAHAATARAAGGSGETAVVPQDGSGQNGWVSMIAENLGNGQVFVQASVIAPGNILYSYGHWQILTPLQHYNTPDGTYQNFAGTFAHAAGNYCAIWWYRDGLGNYYDKGFPCVSVG